MRRALIVLLLAAPAVAGADAPATPAASAPARSVTFAQALAAGDRAPATQIGRHEVAAADALVDAASAWPDPSLRIETNRLTAKVVAGAAVPLPLFGTVGATRRAAAAQAQAVRAATAVDLRDLRRRAATAWIALARADGEIAAATTAAAQAAELEQIARGRRDAGVGAEVDVTGAHAARIRADLAVATAQRAQQAAAAELAGALGWDAATPLVAAGELPGRAAMSLDALRGTLRAHPARTAALRRVDAADAATAEVRAQRWPSVALEAQVSTHDPGTPGTDVMVALSVDVPVFAHNGARTRSARATAAAERARLAVTETQVDAGLVAAYRRWQSASEQVAALETAIAPAQERAAALSAQAYREGARDLASALQADRDLASVRAEVIAARADLATAWTELQAAAGEDLDAPRTR